MRSKAKVADGHHHRPLEGTATRCPDAPAAIGLSEDVFPERQPIPSDRGFDWTKVDLPADGVVENPGNASLASVFFSPAEARAHFSELRESLCWEERAIEIYGKRLLQPRLVAYYGDPGASYRYSGTLFEPHPWTDALAHIRSRIQDAVGASFNAVLCNLYRGGADSMGWHSDDEVELGASPVIASVSLGASRNLRFRARRSTGRRHSTAVELGDGSLLMMTGDLQRNFQHQIPKVTAARGVGPRINLTFRRIVGLPETADFSSRPGRVRPATRIDPSRPIPQIDRIPGVTSADRTEGDS
jgi:alkylated DNA repair dioxygenase AlkB